MIGNKVILYGDISSTNKVASELVADGSPAEGTVVMASYQGKGRGQMNSVWESDAGKNLLCSIILFPEFLPVTNQFLLNETIALGVADTVAELSLVSPKIKWPNDILVYEKKIAGILIENNLKGNLYSSCIAGIGLNINQLVFRNFSYAATSVASLTGKSFNIDECASLLFSKIDYYYELLKKNHHTLLHDLYLQRLFRLNEAAMYEINGKPVKAVIRGIRPEGDLVLEMEDGEVRYIRTREAKYLF